MKAMKNLLGKLVKDEQGGESVRARATDTRER